METWSTGFVCAADGSRIHYYRTGGARPPLVLAHGFSDNGLCWTPVARALVEAFDIIMLDFRGHGLSDRLTGNGPFDLTGDLAAVIEGLELNRPTVLGHSMGAATAAQLAAARPELIGSLALEDPPWWNAPPQAGPGPSPFVAAIRALQAHPPADPVAAARARNPGWPTAELGRWLVAKMQFDLRWFEVTPIYEPFRDLTARLKSPGLLLTGDPVLGALVTPETAREVRRLWPAVQVVNVAGAGHSIRRDRFAAYLQALLAYLCPQPLSR